MAGTLKTAFFNLVKYAANDITSWLTDFNGNMDKIDTALNQNKTAAQTAQDGVDNLEEEYKSLLTVVNGHTTAIDANENAIAANSASIGELKKEFNKIDIGEVIAYGVGESGVSKIEPLLSNFMLVGRGVGKTFSGTFAYSINQGTLHVYDREVIIGGINRYVTDLVRITGNPFKLSDNVWSRMAGFYQYSGEDTKISSNIAVGYVAASGYTVIGYLDTNATPVSFNKNATIFESN